MDGTRIVSVRTIKVIMNLLRLIICTSFLALPFPALSQENQEARDNNTMIIRKLEWVLSDLTRLIEELREVDEPENKVFLAENIEEILYHEVEFPLIYRRAEFIGSPGRASLPALPHDPDSEEPASKLAILYAKAFALGGIARGFEGFMPGAEDYMELARQSYDGVLSLKVRIDSFKEPRTVQYWLDEVEKKFGKTAMVRVTFNGRAVPRSAVDRLRRENVRFETVQAGRNYSLHVAARDFIKGISRRTLTDDSLTWKRIDRFSIYLPPGEYKLVTGTKGQYASRILVESVPDLNFFVVETIGDGVTAYPVPHLEVLEPGNQDKQKPASGGNGSKIGGTDASH